MPHTIHTPALLPGKKLKPVSALEAVGFSEPDPFTRALFAANLTKNAEEQKASAKVPVAPTQALRAHILSMSLFPNIYQK